MTKKNLDCSWCGERVDEATCIKTRDCGNFLHRFHRGCWKKHCDWMAMKPAKRASEA